MKIKTSKKCTTAKVVAKAEPKKPTTKKPASKNVTFTIHAAKGKAIYLAGEFNKWDPTAKKMAFKNGVYTASVKLASGTYQYKYIIDGAWCADPENAEAVPNDQGTFNSLITVR